MKRISKADRVHEDVQLREGILARLGKTALEIGGEAVEASAVVPKLDARIAIDAEVAVKKAEYLAAVAKERAIVEASDAFLALVRQALLLKFHGQPEVLAAFGLAERKAPRALTAEENALKVQRAKATRAARGTRGPRERERIHGDVAAPKPAAPAPDGGAK